MNINTKKDKIPLAITYLGDDFHYYIHLKKRFTQEYPIIDFSFGHIKLPPNEEEEIGPVLHQLSTTKTDIIFLDYSARSQEYLKLGKLFNNQINKRQLPMIGLVGINNQEIDFRNALVRGIKIIHVKGLDFSTLLFQSIHLTKKIDVPELKLMKATYVNDEFTAINIGRIGHVHPNNLHIETDLQFEQNQIIKLKTSLPQECHHTNFIVKLKSRENIYYNLNTCYELDFHFENPELELPKRNLITEWINKYGTDTFPKKTRVMIIDRHLEILTQTKKSIDSYPYSFRFHQVIDNNFTILSEVAPSILCFVMENPRDATRQTDHINDEQTLIALANFVDNNDHIKPFIVVFENKLTDTAKIKYPDIIYHSGSFDFDLLMKLVAIYERKKGVTLVDIWKKILPPKTAENPKPFFFDKTDPRSYVFHEHTIKIDRISEMQLTFFSSLNIEILTSFHLQGKLEMYITVIDVLSERNEFKYTAFINGLNEIGFNKLRVYINEILARPKKKKEDDEKKRFFELNKKMGEKIKKDDEK